MRNKESNFNFVCALCKEQPVCVYAVEKMPLNKEGNKVTDNEKPIFVPCPLCEAATLYVTLSAGRIGSMY
jgi:hypothetical protein